MTVKLTNNFFAKARGLIFEDSGSVTWSFDQTTNELTATASGGGSVTLGSGPPSTLISEGALYFDTSSGIPLQGYVEVPNPNGDPDWLDVVLLLSFDGGNGTNAITDLSAIANVMSASGGASLSTTTPKFGSACGNFGTPAGAGWSTPISAGSPLDLENQVFTVECWVRTSGSGSYKIWSDLLTGNQYIRGGTNSSGQVFLQPNYGTNSSAVSSVSVYDGNWHHVVFQVSTTQSNVAIDGVWGPSPQSYSFAGTANPNDLFQIGFDTADIVQGDSWIGQIDEFRVTLGERYTIGTNFTPPAAAFPTASTADVWDKFGTDITITDGTTSLTGVDSITVSGGVVSGSGAAATITIPNQGVTFTDGSNTVAGATKLTVTGGTVGGTTPNATLTVTGGGGGGSSPFNIEPQSHTTSTPAFPANDYFEGASLDTGGTRFSGATAWAWLNQNGATATLADGWLVLLCDPSSSGANDNIIEQAAPSGTTWTVEAKMFMCRGSASSSNSSVGLSIRNSANGHITYFGWYWAGSNGNLLVQQLSSPTSVNGNPFTTGTVATPGISAAGDTIQAYVRCAYDGTNLIYQISFTGVEGTFVTLYSETAASWLGAAPTHVGLLVNAANSGATTALVCDTFQQIA